MDDIDLNYKNVLLSSLGLPLQEVKRLSAIVGPCEFNDIISKFCVDDFKPGELKNENVLDSYDYCNLKSGDFCVNLHVHSDNSDGKASVERLLNHAAKIADMNFKKTGKPFVLALTDHDTTAGCQKAVKIIYDNPDKFKNLKLSLGVEISTVGTRFGKQLKPVSIHLLVYCINPFDDKLNSFLKFKSQEKLKLACQTIDYLNSSLKEELESLGIRFSLQEAGCIHEMILKGQDDVCPPLRKYTGAKILFTYIMKSLGLNEHEYNIEKPIRLNKSLFRGKFDFIEAYKKGFENYTHKSADLPEYIKNLALKAREFCLIAAPSMENIQPAFSQFDDTVSFVKDLDYGLMSIAHPARIFSDNIDRPMVDFYRNLFESFKKAGAEKAKYYEKYYGSYEGAAMFAKLDSINKAAEECGLLCTGGLDSHGANVIARCPYT